MRRDCDADRYAGCVEKKRANRLRHYPQECFTPRRRDLGTYENAAVHDKVARGRLDINCHGILTMPAGSSHDDARLLKRTKTNQDSLRLVVTVGWL